MSYNFPRLQNAKVISICLATYDPELVTHGPGWGRWVGHIVGVSIGADDNDNWYFPIRHLVNRDDNIPSKILINWLSKVLSNPYQPKIGYDMTYCIGWLKHEGVDVSGDIIDITFAESLINDSQKLDLISLSQKYLGIDIDDRTNKYVVNSFGGNRYFEQIENIQCCEPNISMEYYNSRANLPIKIIREQYKQMDVEGLLNVYRLECRLIRLFVDMRMSGVRVNLEKTYYLRETLCNMENTIDTKIKSIYGRYIDTNSARELKSAMMYCGRNYSPKPKINDTPNNNFFSKIDHPLAILILKKRRIGNLRSTYIDNYLIKHNIDGRIHASYNQLRSDTYGSRSGRVTSSQPCMQNIPSRDKHISYMIRGLFEPDYGHAKWRQMDYNQAEYRMLSHFASGEGSNNLRTSYHVDRNTDYHDKTQRLVYNRTGLKLDRKQIKNINFGLIYGMGNKKLSESLGLSYDDGLSLFRSYHYSCPYVRTTMDKARYVCERDGFVRSISGRKLRLARTESYKALNRMLQGSVADLIKISMAKCYDDGLFNIVGAPKIMVHDELDFSDPGGYDDVFIRISRQMEESYMINVPIIVNNKTGRNWGDCCR